MRKKASSRSLDEIIAFLHEDQDESGELSGAEWRMLLAANGVDVTDLISQIKRVAADADREVVGVFRLGEQAYPLAKIEGYSDVMWIRGLLLSDLKTAVTRDRRAPGALLACVEAAGRSVSFPAGRLREAVPKGRTPSAASGAIATLTIDAAGKREGRRRQVVTVFEHERKGTRVELMADAAGAVFLRLSS